MLDKNPTQTLPKLSKTLNVTPMAVSKRFHAMWKIHKKGIWLPNELSENDILNCLFIVTSLLTRQRKKIFLWCIMIDNEKWIYFYNPQAKETINKIINKIIGTGKSSISTLKRNIHEHKSLLCIWWDQGIYVLWTLASKWNFYSWLLSTAIMPIK